MIFKRAVQALVLLWAGFFGMTGVQGLIDPGHYQQLFTLAGDTPTGINTLRADLSAFFLVSAGGALWGALRPGHAAALFVPAALFGTALAGRALGLALGDGTSAAITQAMLAEGVSVVLMLGAWAVLRRG